MQWIHRGANGVDHQLRKEQAPDDRGVFAVNLVANGIG